MPGKMCAALNKIFTRRHEDEDAKHQRKIDLFFLRFYNWSLTFCRNISSVKFYKVSLGCRNELAHSLIGNLHYTDVRLSRETSRALKR